MSENVVINLVEANIVQEFSDDGIASDESNNSAIIMNGGILNISNGSEAAKVNIKGELCGIRANNITGININNSEEQSEGVYNYEIYGGSTGIRVDCDTDEAAKVNINSGRITALNIATYFTGNVEVETIGGIIGDLVTSIAMEATHIEVSDTISYIPNIKINGKTKIFAELYGIYIGAYRFDLPQNDVVLEIGTDDNGQSAEGVQIISNSCGVYIGTKGETNIIIGKQDDSYNGKNEDMINNAKPVISAYNTGGDGKGIQSSGKTFVDINCKAAIIGDYTPIDVSSELTLTTSNNSNLYEIVTEEIENSNGNSLNSKIIYVKNK